MRAVAWNVNSLGVRLPQVLELLDDVRPDVLALQETKTPDDRFPLDAFEAGGWRVAFAGQKAYNGVALIARRPIERLHAGSPPGLDDGQARLLVGQIGDLVVASVYAPNGQAVGSDKYAYKLRWFDALADWLRRLDAPRVLLLGDFNVAPDDRDVHDPKRWRGKILCSDAERAAFRALLAAGGLIDAVRAIEPQAPMFTWWDYRLQAYRRGWGLRIDHALARGLAPASARVRTDFRERERPSDHAPLIVEFEEG